MVYKNTGLSEFIIIDFQKKGNLIRLFVGDSNEVDYHGDDWDDAPYEHNAGLVYEQYVRGYLDIVIPFDHTVVEPADDWHYHSNSPFCKDDMKEQKVPCLIVSNNDDFWDASFSMLLGDKNLYRVYFGETVPDVLLEFIKRIKGGRVLKSGRLKYDEENRVLLDVKTNKEFKMY